MHLLYMHLGVLCYMGFKDDHATAEIDFYTLGGMLLYMLMPNFLCPQVISSDGVSFKF